MLAKVSIALGAVLLIGVMLWWRSAPQRLTAEEIETLRHDCITMTEQLPSFAKHGAFIVARTPACDEQAARDANARTGGQVSFDAVRFVESYFDCLAMHAREAGKPDLESQLADLKVRAAHTLVEQ